MAESLGAKGGFNYKTGDFSKWIESVTGGVVLFKDSSWILDAVLMTMKSLYVCF